jgi:hypothetical protein
MSLTDLWSKQREQVEGKHVSQVIAFAGEGKLRDGKAASSEFRDFLSLIPSDLLRQYGNQCLDSFENSGFALQDVVNQIGHRLGFQVVDGRYRGIVGQIGYDGIWRFPEGHAVIVEVKTTDAYRIDLNTIAAYRDNLVNEGKISKGQSSILIVVGRQDTGDLEAQIRGSRHAWDIRLISVDALMRLMFLKEEVEDPQIINKISAILIPREFTRLDEIIDIVFSTTEDVKEEEPAEVEEDESKPKAISIEPSLFLDACIKRIEKHVNLSLVKRSRAKFSTPDGSAALVCAVSRSYQKTSQASFWFGFHQHQKEFLNSARNGFVPFGCGSANTLMLIPSIDFLPWLEGMTTTEKDNDLYWHVHIFQEDEKFIVHRKKGEERIDLTKYLLPGQN